MAGVSEEELWAEWAAVDDGGDIGVATPPWGCHSSVPHLVTHCSQLILSSRALRPWRRCPPDVPLWPGPAPVMDHRGRTRERVFPPGLKWPPMKTSVLRSSQAEGTWLETRSPELPVSLDSWHCALLHSWFMTAPRPLWRWQMWGGLFKH